jgi:hypothetical protein
MGNRHPKRAKPKAKRPGLKHARLLRIKALPADAMSDADAEEPTLNLLKANIKVSI